jgi:hypothetical protein
MTVPPDADPAGAFRRVLVPIEGLVSSSLAPRWLFDPVREAGIDVLALHIHDEESIPAFTDQPQHEQLDKELDINLGIGEPFCPRLLGADVGNLVCCRESPMREDFTEHGECVEVRPHG